MERRRAALYALVAFAAATAAAIVIGGARPATGQGIAPTVVQAVGYACWLLAALTLVAPSAHRVGADGKLGAVIVAVIVAVAARLLATSIGSGRRRR